MPAPTPIAVESMLVGRDAEQLWSMVQLVRPPRPEPGFVGLDGITFTVRIRLESEIEQIEEFEVWSPRRGHSPVVDLFSVLVDSLSVADDHPVAVAVATLQGYFP